MSKIKTSYQTQIPCPKCNSKTEIKLIETSMQIDKNTENNIRLSATNNIRSEPTDHIRTNANTTDENVDENPENTKILNVTQNLYILRCIEDNCNYQEDKTHQFL